jgi:hypothetical protein
VSVATDQWAGWSDQQLLDYEEGLYDREVEGEDVWELRDAVIWEMNRRGLCSRS